MPSPIQGGMNNPMWSAGPSNAAASPGMATGMRRLGDMQPWEIPTEQPYTVPGPPTASAAAAMGRDRPEEAAFSDALGRLVRGEAEAAETISTFADICRARAAELKDLASSQLQRAPRYMALNEAAAELEAEAATWQLLWFLHGIPGMDFPAGSGGDFVEGVHFGAPFLRNID